MRVAVSQGWGSKGRAFLGAYSVDLDQVAVDLSMMARSTAAHVTLCTARGRVLLL